MNLDSALLNCPELDGQGKWIQLIVSRVATKWHENPEDLFQIAVLHYLKARSKYDASRGSLSTFTARVVHNALMRAVKTERSKSGAGRRVSASVTPVAVVHDPVTLDAQELEDAEELKGVWRSARSDMDTKARNPQLWLRKRLLCRGWNNQKIEHTISTIADTCDPCRGVYLEQAVS